MRNTNKSILCECENTLILIEQFRKLESFLDDFNFLIFGRDNIVCKNHVFSLQRILNSAQATLGNVVECCKCFCLADAYTLLRKYRDDLFFCLYLAFEFASAISPVFKWTAKRFLTKNNYLPRIRGN